MIQTLIERLKEMENHNFDILSRKILLFTKLTARILQCRQYWKINAWFIEFKHISFLCILNLNLTKKLLFEWCTISSLMMRNLWCSNDRVILSLRRVVLSIILSIVANKPRGIFRRWRTSVGLILAKEKTGAVLITRPRLRSHHTSYQWWRSLILIEFDWCTPTILRPPWVS